jgi:hypothetical protein
MWKGIGSSLTIRGLTLGVEDCLSKVEQELTRHTLCR